MSNGIQLDAKCDYCNVRSGEQSYPSFDLYNFGTRFSKTIPSNRILSYYSPVLDSSRQNSSIQACIEANNSKNKPASAPPKIAEISRNKRLTDKLHAVLPIIQQSNGCGQRLPIALNSTPAAFFNPLHRNCYTARPKVDSTISNNSFALLVQPIAP